MGGSGFLVEPQLHALFASFPRPLCSRPAVFLDSSLVHLEKVPCACDQLDFQFFQGATNSQMRRHSLSR